MGCQHKVGGNSLTAGLLGHCDQADLADALLNLDRDKTDLLPLAGTATRTSSASSRDMLFWTQTL